MHFASMVLEYGFLIMPIKAMAKPNNVKIDANNGFLAFIPINIPTHRKIECVNSINAVNKFLSIIPLFIYRYYLMPQRGS